MLGAGILFFSQMGRGRGLTWQGIPLLRSPGVLFCYPVVVVEMRTFDQQTKFPSHVKHTHVASHVSSLTKAEWVLVRVGSVG